MLKQADPFGDRGARRAPKGRRGWYDFTRWGPCENCGKRRRRFPHHVLLERIVEAVGGDPFDPDNRMLICERCHERHHAGRRPWGDDQRIAFERVPMRALRFAVRLLGIDAAQDYFDRRYA